VALFSAVNESVWEHLKLVAFPFLFFSFIEIYFLKKNLKNFFLAKTAEAYLSTSFIVVFFYSYTALLGKNLLFLDIGSFWVAIFLGKLVNYKILTSQKSKKQNDLLWIIPWLFLILFFFWATFLPPRLTLFRESLNGTYGFFQLK